MVVVLFGIVLFLLMLLLSLLNIACFLQKAIRPQAKPYLKFGFAITSSFRFSKVRELDATVLVRFWVATANIHHTNVTVHHARDNVGRLFLGYIGSSFFDGSLD